MGNLTLWTYLWSLTVPNHPHSLNRLYYSFYMTILKTKQKQKIKLVLSIRFYADPIIRGCILHQLSWGCAGSII